MRLTLALLVVVTAAPAGAHAAPIISLFVDKVCLVGNVGVPILGGGVLEQTEVYSGPLRDIGRHADVEIRANEGLLAGEPTRTLAHSDTRRDPWPPSSGFEVLSVAEFNFPGFQDPHDVTIWDPEKYPSHVAKSRLHWRFQSDATTPATFHLWNGGGYGFVQVKLVDETIGVTVVDYYASQFVAPLSELIDVSIVAGHIYTLTGELFESYLQDADEAAMQFLFPDGPTFVQVTRPAPPDRSCFDWGFSDAIPVISGR